MARLAVTEGARVHFKYKFLMPKRILLQSPKRRLSVTLAQKRVAVTNANELRCFVTFVKSNAKALSTLRIKSPLRSADVFDIKFPFLYKRMIRHF